MVRDIVGERERERERRETKEMGVRMCPPLLHPSVSFSPLSSNSPTTATAAPGAGPALAHPPGSSS
jgi:hypothetical protein